MTIVTSNATTGNTALLNLPMGSFVYYVSGSFVDKDGNQVIPSISSQGSDGTFTISLDEDRNGDSGVASDFVKTCGGGGARLLSLRRFRNIQPWRPQFLLWA